jgi:hypothetical protein
VGIARLEGREEVLKVLKARGLVSDLEVRWRNRMVDEANWAWRGEMPDVFCVD